jgi:hypothetical protein
MANEAVQTGPEAPQNITSKGLASQFAAQTLSGLAAAMSPVATPDAAPAPAAPAAATNDAEVGDQRLAEALASQAVTAARAFQVPNAAPPPTPAPAPANRVDPAVLASRFTNPQPAAATPTPAATTVPEPAPDPAQFVTADGKPDKQAHAFAKLRYENKQFEQQVIENKRKVEEAIAEKTRLAAENATIVEARTTIERERDELRERIGKISLAESPQFQEKYGLKAAELETKLAKALVKFAGVTDLTQATEKARDMLRANPDRLQGLVDNMHPSVQGMAMLAASEFAALDEERQQELSNWRQTSAALGVQEARAGVVRSIEDRRRMADAALAAAVTVGNPVFTAPDPEAKAVGDKVAEAFRGFAQTATEEQLMHAAAEGFAAPVLYQTIEDQAAKIAELTSRIAAFDRARSVPLYPFQAPPAPPPAAAPPPSNVVPADQSDPMQFARHAAGSALRDYSKIITGQ